MNSNSTKILNEARRLTAHSQRENATARRFVAMGAPELAMLHFQRSHASSVRAQGILMAAFRESQGASK